MGRCHPLFGAFLVSSFVLLCSCSRQPPPAIPQFVDTHKVQAVLLSNSEQDQLACEKEISRSHGTVLYKNHLGLLLTDMAQSELQLNECKALVTPNQPIPMEAAAPTRTAAKGNGLDLPTLLRLIPAEEIGARTFVAQNPTYDGRGVIVAVLDTGVEVDHPLLRKTSDGKDKILDFQDLSGEGGLDLNDVTVDKGGTFKASSGATYSVKGLNATQVKFAIFLGSTLAYADALSKQDSFSDIGVITYLNAQGQRRARLDTDNDKSFENEVELFDFVESRLFTKIGAKKSLTVSVNLSADGKKAVLCFDDGAHGTHVSGIATGYDPNGLQGVAPGAQVVLGKIGDNRLAGGSTTTASMMLAIDYAVSRKAQVINFSYGIRAGSNLGKSAIDKYVDKVAKEKNILFSISAGNEGPGILTVGTPSGADLAITNGAYISKQTARDNYGYIGVEDNNIWFFSSVGPQLDGGWKPTLLAPGSALSSVPNWSGGLANYRGTSMASPEVTGGLALLLSAAQQSGLPVDRASITQAVYTSAVPVPSLLWIEQGHGLMNVPQALSALQAIKSDPAVEYSLLVNSPTSPNGKGAGIYVRARTLPSNPFTVTVTALWPSGGGIPPLKTFKLVPSADWIHVPANLWVQNGPKTFQVDLDAGVLKSEGLHSEKISAVDEKTGKVAFEVPVTVVSPILLEDSNQHTYQTQTKVKVGQTLRYFFNVPQGSSAVLLDLVSDRPTVWGQFLDTEGRKIVDIKDVESTSPQPPLAVQSNLSQGGVYELDVVAPATNKKPANVQINVQILSLTPTFGPSTGENAFDVLITNNYEAVKLTPKLQSRSVVRKRQVEIKGTGTTLPVLISDQDQSDYSKLNVTVSTSKATYDLMTDYPYRVFDAKKALLSSGGLELESLLDLPAIPDLPVGQLDLEIQGAFTATPPQSWFIDLKEERVLKQSVTLFSGNRTLFENGQTIPIAVDLSKLSQPPAKDMKSCAALQLTRGDGRNIQEVLLCR